MKKQTDAQTNDRPELHVTKRLQREGRWFGPGGAENERDRIMRELRSAGLSKEEAQQRCYSILDRLFPPPKTGLVDTSDALVDPDYNEPDAGKRLRDGWLWCVEQWTKIVTDTPNGPLINLNNATCPPPNPFALLVLNTYAQVEPHKRTELLTRALTFAEKTHQPHLTQKRNKGFIDQIQ